MIAEGDDAFGSKVGFKEFTRKSASEQNAVVEAGNILISMMMGNEPADSFHLCGCESIYFWQYFSCLVRTQFFLVLAIAVAVSGLWNVNAYIVKNGCCFEHEEGLLRSFPLLSQSYGQSRAPFTKCWMRGASPPSYLIIALISWASINSLFVIILCF